MQPINGTSHIGNIGLIQDRFIRGLNDIDIGNIKHISRKAIRTRVLVRDIAHINRKGYVCILHILTVGHNIDIDNIGREIIRIKRNTEFSLTICFGHCDHFPRCGVGDFDRKIIDRGITAIDHVPVHRHRLPISDAMKRIGGIQDNLELGIKVET